MSQCYQPCISPQWQLLSTHKRQKLGPPAYFVEEEEEEDLVRITISPGRPAPPRRPQPQAGTRRHQGRGQRPRSCQEAAGGWEGGGCGAPWGDRGGLRHRAAIEWKIRDKSGREGRYPMLSNAIQWLLLPMQNQFSGGKFSRLHLCLQVWNKFSRHVFEPFDH